MTNKATVTVRGVPLEVEYTYYEPDGIVIHEVWIIGIEMLVLLDDRYISQIGDEVLRRITNGKETVLP